MVPAQLLSIGTRLGTALGWVVVAPILMAIDLAVLVVTLDGKRLAGLFRQP